MRTFDVLHFPRNDAGFLVHRGDLYCPALTSRTVEVTSPQAFHGSKPCVAVCPTVRSTAFARMFLATFVPMRHHGYSRRVCGSSLDCGSEAVHRQSGRETRQARSLFSE